jgi:hypothetical protein
MAARASEAMVGDISGRRDTTHAMNHRHRKVLHALFAHPVSANVDFKEVLHVFEALGAEIDSRSGNRVGITLNGHVAAFTHVHHSLPKEEVLQIRKFLEGCGVDPAAYPV